MKIAFTLKKSVQTALIAFAGLTTLSTLAPQAAFAAKAKSDMSKKVGLPLQEAEALMNAKKWKEALAKIKEADAVPDKTAAEDTAVNEHTAVCLYQLKDIAGTLAVYETMLAKNQFKPEEVSKRISYMGQLYFSIKNYPKALQYSERYLKEVGQDSATSRQIAQIYYAQNDFAKTIEQAQKFIKAGGQGSKPAEQDWYLLLMSAQSKSGKDLDMANTLEQVLAIYPSENYWSSIFKQAKNESSFNDRQNIILLRLRNEVGVISQEQMVEFAELSIASLNPGDAKTILEQGFAKGVLTGPRNEKLLARAKTEAVTDLASLGNIEKEAAAKPTGEPLVKIGEGYIGHGQYENAIAAITKGLAKGGVSFKDEATINLGIAYLGAKKPADAIKTFKSVPATSKVARLARLWAIQATAPAKPVTPAKAK